MMIIIRIIYQNVRSLTEEHISKYTNNLLLLLKIIFLN